MKSLKELEIGHDIIDYLICSKNHLDLVEEKLFFITCRNFSVTSAKEFQTRLQLQQKVITSRYIFHQKNSSTIEFRKTVPNLNEHFQILLTELSVQLKEAINNEWELLPIKL